jgi:hypothetical protein|tara:strand:- start:310 stop:579 length:270 start_codon:yes stop_codon:yes gene_type:complete
MAAQKILEWKLIPRLMMLMMSVSAWRVVEWFMTLQDPTSQQAALVSVVTGAMTGAFAVWMNHEGKGNEVQPTRPDRKANSERRSKATGV